MRSASLGKRLACRCLMITAAKRRNKMNKTIHIEDPDGNTKSSSRISRRDMIRKSSVALAAGSLLWGAGEARANGSSDDVTLAPRYYPRRNFRPDINLSGKLAVITGASRGNGRAIGEALAALGVDVIGTSRDPGGVPNPPLFPLLPLDITDPASVLAFRAALLSHPTFQQHGQVDILANNAGRGVIGQIIPMPPTDLSFYMEQRDLGIRTLYSGHVMMTNVMLPLMPQQGYSRILYTVSVASYYTGAGIGFSFLDDYSAGKAALRAYANNLDVALQQGGSSIRVSTVNPYAMNTLFGEHPNPIYTQPVGSSGLSDTDPVFNAVITFLRQALANGLPPAMVGDTYSQLLRMADPEQNVVVASPREPFATQGGNAIIRSAILAENRLSAVPFKCD